MGQEALDPSECRKWEITIIYWVKHLICIQIGVKETPFLCLPNLWKAEVFIYEGFWSSHQSEQPGCAGEGSSGALLHPAPASWVPHTPGSTSHPSMVSEWPSRYSLWTSRNSGQKTENRISSQIYFFLRSSSHSHVGFEFLLTVSSEFLHQKDVCVL